MIQLYANKSWINWLTGRQTSFFKTTCCPCLTHLASWLQTHLKIAAFSPDIADSPSTFLLNVDVILPNYRIYIVSDILLFAGVQCVSCYLHLPSCLAPLVRGVFHHHSISAALLTTCCTLTAEIDPGWNRGCYVCYNHVVLEWWPACLPACQSVCGAFPLPAVLCQRLVVVKENNLPPHQRLAHFLSPPGQYLKSAAGI